MALVIADRVRETSVTSGTADIALGGAVTGFQSFAVIGNANTTYYCIAGQGTNEWEVGIGTYVSSTNTLERTTVLSNSSGTAPSKINFLAGIKDVFVTYPAGKSVDTDSIDGVNVNGAGILEVNTTLDNGTNARIVNSPLFEQIQLALQMSRINGAGIFGAAGLASYIRRAIAGGSQDGIGYDLLAMIQRYGIAAVYDRHLTAALAGVNATNLAVGMGSIVPVGFSLYEAECNKLNDSSNVANTIYDPATGMKFDYRMTRPCDDWNIVIKASYQFYTAPDYLYKVGSNFEGVKGLAGIAVTCTDLTPCAA